MSNADNLAEEAYQKSWERGPCADGFVWDEEKAMCVLDQRTEEGAAQREVGDRVKAAWNKPAAPIGPVPGFAERVRPSIYRADVSQADLDEMMRKGPGEIIVVKDTNPKDAAGSARIDATLVSPFSIAEMALAMEEGAAKYGAFNYTVVGVKARVYIGAAMRHLWKYLLGESRDPKTGVHHLGSVMACAGILIDAEVRGKLNDDRPPSEKSASTWLDGMEARVKKVRGVFSTFSPRHYTIEDTQNGTGEPLHTPGAQAPAEGDLPREDAQPLPGRDA